MVVVKSVDTIVQNLLDFFKVVQPKLDTKPGTVSRDLLIDAPSNQLALLYQEISSSSNQNSFRLVSGSDLDKLAKNFGITRKISSPSSGIAILTFNSLLSAISIPSNGSILAINGFSFKPSSPVSILPANANYYKSIAVKYKNDLDFVGIADQYAVEITIVATSNGTSGNLGKYAINSTTISGITHATNTSAFTGGSDQETDDVFRNRIFAIFSGSSFGTALGYRSAALSTTGVVDAYVVEPGDTLMTRDGTVVSTDNNGNRTIVSEGTGGKVDVVILGLNLIQNTNSYIYTDKSNSNDPTNVKNNVVLGQNASDALKTISRRRIDNIANGTIPAQPVENIIQVSGSRSGANFKPKTIDSLGRVSGNYELIKDTGAYAGSPFGLDRFAFIDNKISLYSEDVIKGQFVGQDGTTYSDVLEIPTVKQNVSISSENSNISSSDRSLIQLLHTPVTNVTRVFNVNTGETYTVVSQNPNGTSSINATGVIKISGSTLPTQSDVLQVDYTWVIDFDQYSDYDGLSSTENVRQVSDSIDWGYSNEVRDEDVQFSLNSDSTSYVGKSSLPINTMISALAYTASNGTVYTVPSGVYAERLAIDIKALPSITTSIKSAYLNNTYIDVYKTSVADGAITNSSQVIGTNLLYTTTLILPTDTKAVVGSVIDVSLNSYDVFNIVGSVGSINSNQITIPKSNYLEADSTINLSVSYVSSVQDLVSVPVGAMPISHTGNGFNTNSVLGFANTYVNNLTRKENSTVKKNSSNQYYLDLSVIATNTQLLVSDIISVIRLSDSLELWNADNQGTVAVASSGSNYQVILNGHNTPAISNNVLVIYKANDYARFQPFSFQNTLETRTLTQALLDSTTNSFFISLNQFADATGVSYQIIDQNTNHVYLSGSDGYIYNNLSSTQNKASFTCSTDLTTLVDASGNPISVINKGIRILNSSINNNNNTYSIYSLNTGTNTVVFGSDISNIEKSQVSVIRVLDGKEIWTTASSINLTTGKLVIPNTSSLNDLDYVFVSFLKSKTIKQSPARLSITVADQVSNSGVLSVSGTTITKAKDVVFSLSSTSLKISLLAAFKTALGLTSSSSVPSNVSLVRVAKLERVTTTNSVSNDVLTVNGTYDIIDGSMLNNLLYPSHANSDTSLTATDFVLPDTSNNNAQLEAQLSSGDRCRITFYYTTDNDLENLNFTANGTLYTNKIFALIDKVYVSSGFTTSQSVKFTLTSFNQPITGSRYTVYYDYTAPKVNERITIGYNYNKLIGDTTLTIENARPINADVLVKEATTISVDMSMTIVVSAQYITSGSTSLVLQNVSSKIATIINSSGLGTTLDSSSLVNAAFSVDGVSAARINSFNKTNVSGQVASITAHNDQYFVAGTLKVSV
jgi:uncharacterized phage protein gp47/JayE